MPAYYVAEFEESKHSNVCTLNRNVSSHDNRFILTLSELTLLGMRVGPSVHFLFALLSWIQQSSQLSRLGRRDLTQLSTEQIITLANSVSPVKNIDTRNPDSHLSKLLIPRPGALCIVNRQCIFFHIQAGSWKRQQHFCSSTHYRCIDSFELACRRR